MNQNFISGFEKKASGKALKVFKKDPVLTHKVKKKLGWGLIGAGATGYGLKKLTDAHLGML